MNSCEIKISNPYTVKSSAIKVNNSLDINGYYDDSEIKERLSLLEAEVDEMDENFEWRLARIEGNYVTKEEFNSLESRVTTLETTPVGISNEEMDEILD